MVFSIAQIECQIEISKGAGIHPIKATKNTKPAPVGNTCSKVYVSIVFNEATPVEKIVLIAKIKIIILIILSSRLYLPTNKIK